MQELNLTDILQNTEDLKEKKVGYVAIVGRPNTGKSTFVNTLIGEKISITTNVPQTTRNKILAIFNDSESQIIFFDTPGIHESAKDFNKEINGQAISSLRDAEVILYFVDSSRSRGSEEEYIEKILENAQSPVFKVYTKIDLHSKIHIPEGENIFAISSLEGQGFDELMLAIKHKLPTGPTLFPEDYYTKQNLHFRISEIVREKLFEELKEELPHSVFVAVEEIEGLSESSSSSPFTKEGEQMVKISAYIYAETDSQKYIIIGKGGSLLTKVGKNARVELEQIFDQKVFLSLRVKVKKNWRKDEGFIKKMLG
ncbi:GTPase Era [Candidatus Gracilibacteria bacterium]|nr:GTPase Era [Candidatus Gracilibacteria bacterium]